MAVFTDALNSIGADGGGYLAILEPGLYELTAPLYAPPNTVITVGPGVTLKSVGGTYLIRNVSSRCLNYKAPGDIHVRGEGVLDASGNRFTGTDGCGGVAFVQCENVSVTGVTITGIRNLHAIEYQSAKGGRIQH